MSLSEEVATVKIPLRVWGRLATEAESRGQSISELLVAAIGSVIGRVEAAPEPAVRARRAVAIAGQRRATPAQIAHLKSLILAGGLSPRELAEESGASLNAVHKWSRELRGNGAKA